MSIAVPSTPDAFCCTGGPATGKSSLLASRARDLALKGEHDVVLVCASVESAHTMRERLCDFGVQDICVLTAREMALAILDDAAVRRRRGGGVRVLNPLEESVLVEDVKTCGCKRGRLRDLLAFLERGWSDLSDDDPAWIQTCEERTVVDLVQANLKFTGGVLESQLVGAAVRAAAIDSSVRARYAHAHVLVDDYACIGRAAQVLVNLLAVQSIAVAADPAASLPVCDPYPYTAGVTEFLRANPQAETIELTACYRPEALVSALNGLRGAEGVAGAMLVPGCGRHAGLREGGMHFVDVRMEQGIAEECRAVVWEVKDAVQQGVSPDRIFVAGMNGVWRANMQRALASCGIPACLAPARMERFRFDAYRAKNLQAKREYVLERLVRDDEDSLAWRAWCGLGDSLACSASVALLRGACASSSIRFAKALELLDDGKLAGIDSGDRRFADLLAAYREGREAIRAFRASGDELSGSEPISVDSAKVLVGSPLEAFGREFDLVVFGGFVNGFIPSRDYFDQAALVGAARERARKADAEMVSRCVGCARCRVVFTGFTNCGLETAERLKLRIARIRLQDGVRLCSIEPSDLLKLIQV